MRHLKPANGTGIRCHGGKNAPASQLCYIFIDWGSCDTVDQCGFDFGDCGTRDVCLIDY